jgi:hypothetical protein
MLGLLGAAVRTQTFIALPKLNDNFISIEKPNPKSRNMYQKCLVCSACFYGSTVAKKAHVLGKEISGIRNSPCTNPNKALREEIRKELAEQETNDIIEKQKQEIARNGAGGVSVIDLIRTNTNLFDAADQSVLEFIATNDLPPFIVESNSFKKMKNAFVAAGPSYKLPHRLELGLDHGKAGKVLSNGLTNSRILRAEKLREIKFVGGTLCSDGAKNRKRPALNSTIMTLRGVFFVQSTNATGMHNTTGKLKIT